MRHSLSLPALPLRFTRIYRFTWITTYIACVLAVSVYGFYAQTQRHSSMHAIHVLGLRVADVTAAGVFVSPIDDAVRRKGVRDGELITAINDVPAPVDEFALAHALQDFKSANVRLDLTPNSGPPNRVTLMRSQDYETRAYRGGLSPEVSIWVQYVVLLVPQSAALLAAVLLFLRRMRDPVAALLSVGLMLATVPIPSSAAGAVIGNVSGACLIAAVVLFPTGRIDSRWTALALILEALNCVTNLASFWLAALSGIALLLGMLSLLGAIVVLAVRYRDVSPGLERQQLKFAFLGFGVSSAFALISMLIALYAQGPVSLVARVWASLLQGLTYAISATAFSAGLLVALLRYRLYDAESVISRSAAFAFMTLMLGAVFAGSQKILAVLGEHFFGHESGALSAGIAAAIAAMVVAPLHNRIREWTERRFHRALALLDKDLPQILEDLREFANVDGLIEVAVEHIKAATHANDAKVLLKSKPDGDGGAHFPLEAKGTGHVGWLSVGERPDGSPVTRDEREALRAIAPSIARGIYVIQRREAREAMFESRLAALEKTLAGEGRSRAV